MTDRDRLAADLSDHNPNEHPTLDFIVCDCGDHDFRSLSFNEHVADRLIALGWTRECEHCDPRHVWPCPTIQRCDEPGCEDEANCGWPSPDGYRRTCGTHWRTLDPAIAKAYREDAG